MPRTTSTTTTSSTAASSTTRGPVRGHGSGPISSGPGRPSVARGLIVLGVALALAMLVWVIAVPVTGRDLSVGPQHIGPLAIMVATLVPGVAGWALRAVLGRWRHGRVIWLTIAALVLALSLLGPLASGATGMTLVVLETLHLAVGGAILLGFGR